MIHEYQLRALPEQAVSEQTLKEYISREKGLDIRTIHAVRTLKRSIDARQRTIYINLKVQVFVNEDPADEQFVRTEYPNVEGKQPVVVVGAGPGGLFAAPFAWRRGSLGGGGFVAFLLGGGGMFFWGPLSPFRTLRAVPFGGKVGEFFGGGEEGTWRFWREKKKCLDRKRT